MTRTASMLGAVPPPAQVILAILSIQVGAAVAVDLFPALGPGGTVFWRVAISALLLTALIRPALDASVWRHRLLLLGYGATLGMMNWCFYESIARIPLGLAVTIEFMGPLTVGVLTSRRRIDLLWIAIAVAGLFFLAPDLGEGLDRLGVAFAILAGIGWGAFVLMSKRVSAVFPGSSGLVCGMIVASAALAPFAVGSFEPLIGDVRLAGSLVLIAVLSTAIPFYFEFSALKSLTAQTYGVLITLEPAVAAAIGVVVLGDTLGLQGLIAIACVTLAAFGATVTRQR